MYQAVNRALCVQVTPIFMEEESDPEAAHFVWAYQVRIENQGPETVQLLRRHWIITDGGGRRQDVEGEGVIGEQPVLKPGEHFDYTSGCPLTTASGIMVGTYQMKNDEGELFDIAIPAFSLDSPYEIASIN
jgi:ApaG protein